MSAKDVNIVNEQQRYLGFRVQASAFGLPIPIGWGRNRAPGNLMWYGDFTPVQHTQESSSGGGKGGGAVKQTNISYTYTTAVAILLGEGPINTVLKVWADKELVTTPGAKGFSIFTGSYSQSPWAHLTTNHPSEALSYRGIAYLAAEAYDLGGSSGLPNHNFEVAWGFQFNPGGGIFDANPKDVANDFLTNVHYGVGILSSVIGDWTQWSNYCVANSLFLSPLIAGQRDAAEFLEHLAKLTNTGIVYSDAVLKMVPYSDESATGNSVTFTPDVAPIYDLTDDDFLHDEDEDPVKVMRSNQADAFNMQSLVFSNRANQYNGEPVEAKDQANIELYGLRPAEPVNAPEIQTSAVAKFVVQNILQRSLYVRERYEFRLGWRYALIEPMDVLLITDSVLGLSQARVRVLEIQEDDDDGFTVMVEEFPTQIAQAAVYANQAPAGFTVDYNKDPGNTVAEFVDAPGILAATGFELWIAAAGGVDWGGCNVHVSFDGATYKQVGSLHVSGRFGVIHTANFPTGNDPDTVNTAKVDLTTSRGSLMGGTQAQADQFSNLAWLNKELIAYTTATLTASFKYDLTTYIRRGVYNTVVQAHPIGTKFVRLDDFLFKYAYPPDMVGKPLWIKLQSFNAFGAGVQDVSALTPFQITIGGPIGAPNTPTGFSVQQFGAFVNFSVNKVPTVYLDRVEVRFADPGETDWNNGIPVVNILRGNTDTNATVPPGTWRFMARAFDRAGNPSPSWAVFDFTVTAETFTTIITQQTFPGWPGRDIENWLARSNDLSVSPWSASNVTMTANQRLDSFKALTLAKLAENTANAEHYEEQILGAGPFPDNQVANASVYAIANERTWLYLAFVLRDNSTVVGAFFNLAAGTVGSVGSGVTAKISKQMITGGYVCTISRSVGTGGSEPRLRIQLSTDGSALVYTGTSGSGIFVGNAQMTKGAIRRESAPTGASALTTNHGNLNVSVSYALVLDTNNVATDLSDAELWDQYAFGAYSLCTYQQPEMDKLLDARVRVWADIVSVLGPAEAEGTANPPHQVDYRLNAGSYDGFENWTIGTANFRFLKSRTQFSPDNGKIKITAFKTAIDTEPHIEEGVFTTPAGGSQAVLFTTSFHLTPSLQVTPQGSGNVSASFDSLTRLGFTGYHKTGGSASAGTVVYQARGA